MSTIDVTQIPESTATPIAEQGTNALLFALGAAMLLVTGLACVLIVEGTLLWLLVAFGGLLVTAGIVGAFILQFIGDVDDH